MNAETINPISYIDHTLLDNLATSEQIEKLCAEADRYGFAAVCVYPSYVKLAVSQLHNKKPKVCTVIGFPSGASTSATKLYEAQEAADNGATELDVVINLAWLKDGEADRVYQEIAQISESTRTEVKAILEMELLTIAEQKLAAEICLDAGAAYLKTHTGWRGGVTVAQVELLAAIAKGRAGIKAAGGIRTLEQAQLLIAAGATRLGLSRGVELVQELG
jgi:deoxyribose-phosphate aldolase